MPGTGQLVTRTQQTHEAAIHRRGLVSPLDPRSYTSPSLTGWTTDRQGCLRLVYMGAAHAGPLADAP